MGAPGVEIRRELRRAGRPLPRHGQFPNLPIKLPARYPRVQCAAIHAHLPGDRRPATIGAEAPKNLGIVVLDNERYGETGMQKTHTRSG